MKLATLLRRSGTGESKQVHDEAASIQSEWDHLRDAAESKAERTEIDAVFSRVMP